MSDKFFRLVKEEDAEEILSVYKPYIDNTAITFECESPTLEEFTLRIQEISKDYPYIICEENDKIIGYAYAHRQMERAAYQWNAELSVYIDGSHIREGLGKAMYRALIDILKLQKVKNVYGGVTSPNPNSEKLHEHFGFSNLGTYHQTGFKCGAWHDVTWFEKTIGEYSDNPEPPISIKDISNEEILRILKAAEISVNNRS